MEQKDMQSEIGDAAGMIYRTFSGKGVFDLIQLKRSVKVEDALIPMAIGWLSRENKISAKKEEKRWIFEIMP